MEVARTENKYKKMSSNFMSDSYLYRQKSSRKKEYYSNCFILYKRLKGVRVDIIREIYSQLYQHFGRRRKGQKNMLIPIVLYSTLFYCS